ILFLSVSLFAQERVLLHIDKNGQQEATPLKKGERVKEVIERLEQTNAASVIPSKTTGLIDTLRYFSNNANLLINFTFAHQDLALQYYLPAASGIVKEFWWRNYTTTGNLHKATIRAWNVDPKVMEINMTKPLGRYKDPADGDGLKTPYKPATGDQWFYKIGDHADTIKYGFDPLGTEAKWLAGGVQVNLNVNTWQGIKLGDWGDTLGIELNVPFGFTLQNDTKISDIAGASDTGMNILSGSALSSPYHSFKFYETQRLATDDGGWWLRTEYEWGMYVVVEYCADRYPKFTITRVPPKLLKVEPKNIDVYCSGFSGPCNSKPDATAGIYLKYKNKSNLPYDSVLMITKDNYNFSGTIPAYAKGDTVYYYAVALSVSGKRMNSTKYSYRFLTPAKSKLLIYNNAQYSLANAAFMYLNNDPLYDLWSAPNDGIGELADLLVLYSDVVLVDGSFTARNVFPAITAWLKSGTTANKKNLFYTSQDYGCFIQADCADTSFAVGTFENDYLGIAKLGPQDVGPTTRPFKMVPQSDVVTNYLIKYNSDSSTTLWHFPTYEFTFAGYPDIVVPSVSSKALFKDGTGSNVFGVRNSGSSFNTTFFAFDVGALYFRSDTSLTPANDPKNRRISDVKALANMFFDVLAGVSGINIEPPNSYALLQNFPNPFNPSTTIQYTVGQRTNVQLNVYNVLGQKVAALVNETKEPGRYTASFNGRALSSGLYFYEMRAGSFVSVKKMMLLK
ncbi:MAG: T9SS type A sorting domain-containing protein, partial [Bacteroidota bacterium]